MVCIILGIYIYIELKKIKEAPCFACVIHAHLSSFDHPSRVHRHPSCIVFKPSRSSSVVQSSASSSKLCRCLPSSESLIIYRPTESCIVISHPSLPFVVQFHSESTIRRPIWSLVWLSIAIQCACQFGRRWAIVKVERMRGIEDER